MDVEDHEVCVHVWERARVLVAGTLFSPVGPHLKAVAKACFCPLCRLVAAQVTGSPGSLPSVGWGERVGG